ncbi:hypothetical protein EV121DRAFT_274449 [Schizophyllum commune]
MASAAPNGRDTAMKPEGSMFDIVCFRVHLKTSFSVRMQTSLHEAIGILVGNTMASELSLDRWENAPAADSVLQPTLKRALQALHPSKLPCHPLNDTHSKTVTDGLRALCLFALLAVRFGRTDVPRSLVQAFPTVWRWVVFFSPAQGNVDDAISTIPSPSASLNCAAVLHPDGRMTVDCSTRYHCLSQIVSLFLRTRSDPVVCAAQADVATASMVVLSRCPSIGAKSVQTISSIVLAFAEIMEDTRSFSGMVNNPKTFEQTDPGAMLLNILKHVRWLASDFGSDRHVHEEHAEGCLRLIVSLLRASSRIVVSFHCVGGMSRLTSLLLKLTHFLGHLHPARHSMTLIALECIRLLSTTRPSHRGLVAALDSGLLLALHNICSLTGTASGVELQTAGSEIIQSTLISQLVWPSIRRAFEAAAIRHGINTHSRDAHWLEWRGLLEFFTLCKVNRVAYKMNRQSISSYCHNPKFSMANTVRLALRTRVEVVLGSRDLSLSYEESDTIRVIALLSALKQPLPEDDIFRTPCALLIRLDMFEKSEPSVRMIPDFDAVMEGEMHIYATVLKMAQKATVLVATVQRSAYLTARRTPVSQLIAPSKILGDLFSWCAEGLDITVHLLFIGDMLQEIGVRSPVEDDDCEKRWWVTMSDMIDSQK